MCEKLVQSHREFLGYYDSLKSEKNILKKFILRLWLWWCFMGYIPIYKISELYFNSDTEKYTIKEYYD